MYSFKIILLISLFFTFSFSKGEVSKIFAHKEDATDSSYTVDGKTYRWGQKNNIVIDGFEYNGHRYNYVSESPIIKIRRADNANASGEPCGIFAEKKGNGNGSNRYKIKPAFPQDCNMAKVMGGRIINIGALDLFKNGNDSYDTPKNIERVDFISPNGITAPSILANLAKAGHVVTEKSGNNEIKIAAILSLDANGDPSSFGSLVTVHDQNGDAGSRKVDYGNTFIHLDNGSTIGWQKLGFYRNEKHSPQTPEPTLTGNSNEKLGMAFVSLEDLDIGINQKYYGFAYFASDVYDNTDLVDYTSFPKNTPISSLGHTDTADPYGGVASYFVDEEIITISITDTNTTEGNNGTKEINFTITLDKPAPNGGVTVQIQPHNITALEGEDYTRQTSSISFAQGESSNTVYYLINGDTKVEDDETFKVQLHNPQNAILGSKFEAIGTIINDDSDEGCLETVLTIQRQISSENDDAEEEVSDGDMYRTSSDLEMTRDGHQQIIGLRFRYLDIPKNATITNAYIQFTTDERDSESTNLTIYGQDIDNASEFSNLDYDISSRIKTTASASWSPPAWNSEDEQGTKQQTTELKNIVQEIVQRGGWSSGNAMAFIISGTGKRVADSSSGNAPILHIEYMGCPEENNSSSTAICYALPDNHSKVYKVLMSPNSNPLPIPEILSIPMTFDGEGSAYRASNHMLYAFEEGSSSDLYTIDLTTGAITEEKNSLINGSIEGAEFYYDPVEQKEILYITSEESNSKLYAFYADTWTLLNGYPKNIHGSTNSIDSLAVDPVTGKAYASDDYEYDGISPNIHELNLKTGKTIFKIQVQGSIDAEGLAYASDGNLYVEDEGYFDGRKIYQINLETGELTPSAFLGGSGDVEGISCNGTAMAIEYPTIVVDSTSSVVEGNSSTTDLNFLVKLSKPAVEDVLFSYAITDETAISGEDYIAENNLTAIIYKDSNATIITIKVKGDIDIESDETILINVVDATNAIVDSSSMVGTIINDDYYDNNRSIELIADYHFDECFWNGTEGEVLDSSETYGDGTATNANTTGDGLINRSGYFDHREKKVTVPYNSDIELNRDITIALWIKPKEFSSNSQSLITKSATKELDLEIKNGYLYFRQEGKAFGHQTAQLTQTDQWYHIVITRDMQTKMVKYYINGSKVFEDSFNRTDIHTSSKDIVIAKYNGNAHAFNGTMDELKIYIGVLNDSNITQIYDNELDGKNYDGTDRDNIICRDFGDLPNTYATTLENNGARHQIDTAIGESHYLGYGISLEDDGKPSTDSSLDEYDDGVRVGVSFIGSLPLQGYTIESKANIANLSIKTTGAGYLNAWVDWNRDGEFTISEQIADGVDGSSGEINLNISPDDIPQIDFNGEPIYARFRYSSMAELNATGVAPDGEVEDYRMETPRYPDVHIENDISKYEGDNGDITEFRFRILVNQTNITLLEGTTLDYNISSGTASLSDADYLDDALSGSIPILSNTESIDIIVKVKGDNKLEAKEYFYLNIFNSEGLNIRDAKGEGEILNDDSLTLNIERTNSDTVNNSTQEHKESLYTQISGRDFNYAIVSYTKSNEAQIISDTTVKIELIDKNSTQSDEVIYEYYHYISGEGDRFNIINSNDLTIPRATRDAEFRVSYLLDVNDTLLRGSFNSAIEYNATNALDGNREVINRSDNFAIRPDNYRIEIADLDKDNNPLSYRTNSTTHTTPLNLVAEHEYRLKVDATRYSSEEIALKYGHTTINKLKVNLIFDTSANGDCNIDANVSNNSYKFVNGQFNSTFSHNNTGKYRLEIVDNNWTAVDKNIDPLLAGCILNNSTNSVSGDNKSGCNVASNSDDTHHDIKLSFQPFSFDMNNTVITNISGNGKKYIYMSDLTLSQEMGVQINSTIIAEGKDGGRLTNFTESCIDEVSLSLGLDFSLLTDEGLFDRSNFSPPKSLSGEILSPQQNVKFNGESNSTVTMMKNIEISNKFLDANSGTMNINILYNMEKLFSEPTNPIKVNFISLELNTTGLEAKIVGEETSPTGVGSIDENRTFYFARVASYRKNYPETKKKSKKTPLFVEIFCKIIDNNEWCTEIMNLGTIGKKIGKKTDRGWYLAKDHDSTTEGTVLRLRSDNPLKITTNHTDNIPAFENGRIKNIIVGYIHSSDIAGEEKAEIAIDTDVWLRFNKRAVFGMPLGTSSYSITLKGIATTTGVGMDGNEIESVRKVEHNGKMTW